jgi:hypothetical protein
MKFERQIGNRSVYTDIINGRTVRATTVNGEQGAKALFEIMRKTQGTGISTGLVNQDLAKPPRY